MDKESLHHRSADDEVVYRYATYFCAPSWMFPACLRLPSLDLVPALPAGLGCCFPVLDIVIPLGFPSALGPPFTIAVAIVKIGQDWWPDGGQPPDRERETADVYLSYFSECYQNKSLGEKRKDVWDVEKDRWGQLKRESDKVGSGC